MVGGFIEDGWMDDLRFYVLFNCYSISVIHVSGRYEVDNDKLCEMEPRRFTVAKMSPRAGLEPGTARSVGQRLTH